ncbi:MAG: ribokinase [Armatimonadota bacterium]|nr:ribokinase [Armatimonadota bacterium]MDR7543377.1 ribokinase [Armatimonadota bacterium]
MHVTVLGSLNTDLVVWAPRLPQVGETVPGGTFAVFHGGKGANQAVAAARLGAEVTMIGCVGADAFGRQLIEGLAAEGIDTRHVRVADGAASGVALITVDPQARNTIVVAAGANERVEARDVDAAAEAIAASQVLLLQLEVPLDAVVHAATLARRHRCCIILDPAPAPAAPLPKELFESLSVIVPNEVEARVLTGVDVSDEGGAAAAARRLLVMGAQAVVIKRGAAGALWATGSESEAVPGIPVRAVDSTAAGDAFAAALGVALGEGRALRDAVRLANAAAALSVTRMGAQPSMPRRDEVTAFARARGLSV